MLCDFDTLYLDKGKTAMEVTRAFPHKNVVVMKFQGIDKIEQAQPLIGKILYLDRDDAELEEGLYFIQDIIGLTVKDADTGEIYGKITDVYQNGASDVLNTDIDAGEMIIRPLPGLFDDDTSEDGE